jgi:hypothetical protein
LKASDPARQSRDHFRPLLKGILAGVVLLLMAGMVLLDFHQIMSREVAATMRNSLRRTALACALTVDPAAHESLREPEQEGSQPYLDACNQLQRKFPPLESHESVHLINNQ